MKRFICGFLIGAMLFGAIGTFAASYVANPVSFKVLVNGEEFTSDPPPVEINGRTYLPLRAIGDALGVPVNWNQELFQAEVGIVSNVSSNTSSSNYISYKEKPWCPDFGRWVGKTPYADFANDDGSHSYVYLSNGITTSEIDGYCELLKSNGFEMRNIENGYAFANANKTHIMGMTWGTDGHILVLVY